MRVTCILYTETKVYIWFYMVVLQSFGSTRNRGLHIYIYTLENFIFLEKDRALFYKDARRGLSSFDVLFIVRKLDRFFAR